MDLNGKRAIVLGGTSGIGLAVTRQLVEAGARVVAGSRSSDHISEASKAAPGATFVQIDVLDRTALDALFTHHAGFDILVNAATGGERATGPFLQMDLDGFQGSFRKLWGYTNSVRLGAPQMSPTGAIVLVSGYPARKAMPGLSALSSVGNAVEGFVRAVAPEIAPRRINVVSPGVIDTPLITVPDDQRADRLATMTKNQPIARAGTADEVASAIVYLLQNDFITGSTIDVDGGALLP
jgi:NAD(P)-dependent dehydrogenase (short-subunit alcohol dehydrogenase family)